MSYYYINQYLRFSHPGWHLYQSKIAVHLSRCLTMLICIMILSSCGGSDKEQGPQNKPVDVNAKEVATQHVTAVDQYPGTVVPLNEVELRPQVAGYITKIYVEDGTVVKQGQKLYEVNRTKYLAAYQQAQANVQSAKASLAKSNKDLERYQNLSQQDAIAQQRLDYAQTDVETSASQVAVAKAQLESAGTDLGYSIIKAPFGGKIGISKVRLGSPVSVGQTLLNTISTTDSMAVDFVINEESIPRFNRLLQTQSEQPDTLFTIRLGDDINYASPGKVTTIDRAIGRQTGTITIRLTFPNPDQQLIAGMTVDVHVLNQDIGKQLVIPYKAVTEQMSEYFVYVIEGDSVRQQRLKLGTEFQGQVVVREGLKEGQQIVIDGIQKLRPGAKVNVGKSTASGSGTPAASK